jgi:hypothetical protein
MILVDYRNYWSALSVFHVTVLSIIGLVGESGASTTFTITLRRLHAVAQLLFMYLIKAIYNLCKFAPSPSHYGRLVLLCKCPPEITSIPKVFHTRSLLSLRLELTLILVSGMVSFFSQPE